MKTYEYFMNLPTELKDLGNYLTMELTKTRPQEIIIMGLLVVAIGIGIANLIAIKKK